MRRPLTAALCLALTLLLLPGCVSRPDPQPTPTPTQTETPAPSPSPAETDGRAVVRLAVLTDASGLGAAGLMAGSEAGDTAVRYEVTLTDDPDLAASGLLAGTLDAAALPTDRAAALYHQTEGEIRLLAVTAQGGLLILERGDGVRTLSDLAGRTLCAAGEGSAPQHVLDCLLAREGLSPDDADIQWSAADSLTDRMISGEIDLCLLPASSAAQVLLRDDQVRVALNLASLWEDALPGSAMAVSCLAVRADFLEERPQEAADLLAEYAASADLALTDPEAAAPLAAEAGLTADPETALAAIPDCGLTFLTGADMRGAVQSFFEVLAGQDPASIGGSIPDDAFYYIP